MVKVVIILFDDPKAGVVQFQKSSGAMRTSA